LAFLTQNKAKLCKTFIITLVFEKNANFFAENCDHSIESVLLHGGLQANPTSLQQGPILTFTFEESQHNVVMKQHSAKYLYPVASTP
jgi:hemerythrin-like domain-containing protein